jgi:TolB-like protein/DNA-binding winged helix-turn-helix (wHTH) protein
VALATHDSASHQVAHFGPFRLDISSRELFKGGVKVRVQGHSFQVLLMLLGKPGEVVTREELRQRLWHSQTFVDFDQGLNTAMMRLRHALEDAADVPRFIETLPRQGYRFVAPVTFSIEVLESNGHNSAAGLAASGTGRDLSSDPRSAPESWLPNQQRWSRLAVIAAASVLAVLLLGVLNWGSLRALLSRAFPAVRVPTLAVLPFDSLSNDPTQVFLAESMTEQLITELGQSHGLRVVSRGSVMQFSGKHLPLEVVAEELHADNIFEGSISQAGGRLRVTGNLYQVTTRKHLWAETYETELKDGFSPQRDIARDIAQEIEAKLIPK